MLDIDLRAVVTGIRLAAAAMLEQGGGGHIISVASAAGVHKEGIEYVQVYVYMMEVFQVYALHPSKLEQGGTGTSSASHQQHVGTKGELSMCRCMFT
jgi:NAD(P)-dependent dehydrogenase (short-subunit alcohol dehydrogenase family)